MDDEINKFVDLFKKSEQLGFSEITYCQYSEGNGGEICVNHNGMGFSIQLWEEDGRIAIDLALSTYWFRKDLKYIGDLAPYQDLPLCSECGMMSSDGTKMIPWRWHGKFPKKEATPEIEEHLINWG